ncbi:hypothetical protein ACG9Y7_06415 [Acinetobacter gerneri]|uniref:hypothetical protein n=1 Tax=Acinetobacter gerneri TaxID=202952 RepID=UPI003AF49D41
MELSVGHISELKGLFLLVKISLERDFHLSSDESIRLINQYYSKFLNAEFCQKYNFPPQSLELLEHWGYPAVAYRVYYYEALGHEPNEAEFIQWERKYDGLE